MNMNMNIVDLPDDILEKFQVPSGINKKFEEIFNKIIFNYVIIYCNFFIWRFIFLI